MKNKSRTKEIATLHQGFTLIELLVVISIIALLSVIVLGSIQDARTRAQNTKKNEIARQYLNALELYSVSNNSNYPSTGGTDYCLGYKSDEKCFGEFLGDNNDGGLNEKLIDFYPDMPKNDDFLVNVTGSYYAKGILYDCNSESCVLYWHLEGTNTQCVHGATPSALFNSTKCTYYFYGN